MNISLLLPRTRHPKPRRKIERPTPTKKEQCRVCNSTYAIENTGYCFACLSHTIDMERAINHYERKGGGING